MPKAESPLQGLLLIDKAAGWTSHDVVAKARRLTGQRRIGHTGTLDPAATGLLVLCLGQATRLAEYITGHDKRYVGEIALGTRTATDDAEGEVVERREVPPLDEATLRQLEALFSGSIAQVPPAYSAVSVGGERSYKAARRGDPMALAARAVAIHRLTLAVTSPDRVAIEVHCGPGTYIRSLARDVGERLGCGAHLSTLRRTSSGPFVLGDAWTLQELEFFAEAGRVEELLVPADEGMTGFDAALLGGEAVEDFRSGRLHQASEKPSRESNVVRAYSLAGEFQGVASVSYSGEIRAVKVLNLSNSRGL